MLLFNKHQKLKFENLEPRCTPATLFVAPDGADIGALSTLANPFKSLQYAVNKAATNDTILVAAGTYVFDQNAYSNPTGIPGGINSDAYTSLGTDAVVIIKNKKLSINGGFSRNDNFTTSNPSINPTIIDGQLSHRGILVIGITNTSSTGLDLNGFTITQGKATPSNNRSGEDAIDASGGGMLVDFTDTAARSVQLKIRIANVTFSNNEAHGGSPNSNNSNINFGGTASGGGLELKYATDVTINNAIFTNNLANGGVGSSSLRGGISTGGAIHSDHSNLIASDILLTNNKAKSGDGTGTGVSPDGKSADAMGGAVSVQFGSSAVFTRVSASGNLAEGGDALNVPGVGYGGAFYAEQNNLLIRQAVINNNTASSGSATSPAMALRGAAGAGIVADRSVLTLDQVKILENTAKAQSIPPGTPQFAPEVTGAGLYAFVHQTGFTNTTVSVINSVIASNHIIAGSGASTVSSGSGAGIRFDHVQASIVHSTIAQNSLDSMYAYGTAIMLQNITDPANDPSIYGLSVLNLSESIVSNNIGRNAISGLPDSSAITVFPRTTLNLQQNLFYNPQTLNDIKIEPDASSSTAGIVNGLATNLTSADPKFTNISTNDYSLTAPSPAVNAGSLSTLTTDISGNNRVGTSDLGAFELGTTGNSPVLSAPTGGNSTSGGTGYSGANTTPTISSINNITIPLNGTTGLIPFSVSDFETQASLLTVTAVSNNPALVSSLGLPLGGAGTNRTITVNPIPGASGTATITISVRDAGGLISTTSFNVTVLSSTISPTLIGYPQFAVGGDLSSGIVTFYNPDQTVRYQLTPFQGISNGIRTATADFNGDGIADLVVGTGPGSATHVKVFDGVGQGELFSIDPFESSFTGGVYVSAGDINGDGIADLAISPDEGGGPRVRVFNGKVFSQMADFFGIDDPNFRGGARSAIGDVNGDGKGDLIVVAGFGGGPRVAAFNGSQLSLNGGPKLFNDFFALETSLRNGIYVAAGDVNGDGFADIIAGGGPGGGPRVFILDGKSLIQNGSNSLVSDGNYFAGDVNSRGGIRVAIKNLDGDNKADVIAGAGTNAGSRVSAYLGKDTSSLGGTPPAILDFFAYANFNNGVFVG